MVTKDLALSKELNKRELRYIWHGQKENSAGEMYILKEKCSDTKCHNLFADIRTQRSRIFYCDMKFV